jgi:WD40 repeat protein
MARLTTLCILLFVSSVAPLRAQPATVLPRHHEITAVAVSPDDRTVASVSRYDRTLKLFDVASGAFLGVAVDSGSFDVAFAPDGASVAVTGADHGLRIAIYSVPELRLVRAIVDTSRWGPRRIAWSPDGSLIASAAGDSVTLWSTATGEHFMTLPGPRAERTSLAFSTDGERLYAAGDRGIEMWAVATGTRRTVIRSTARTSELALSSDERWLLTGWPRVTLWDLASGDSIRSFTDVDYRGRVAFAPGDSLVVVQFDEGGDSRGQVGTYRRETGALVHRNAGLEAWTLALAHSAPWYLASDLYGGLSRWNYLVGRREQVVMSNEGFSLVRVSTDGNFIATNSSRGIIMLDRSGVELPIEPLPAWEEFALAPDGRRIVLHRYNELAIYDIESGDSLYRLTIPGTTYLHKDLEWSPDGRFIASAGDTLGRVHVWSPDGELVRMLPATTPNVDRRDYPNLVEFTRGGEHLMQSSHDGMITIWSTATWDTVALIDARALTDSMLRMTTISADGRIVAVSGGDRLVTLIEASTGRHLQQIVTAAAVRFVSFLGSSQYLHVATTDGVVGIWTIESDGRTSRVVRHTDYPVTHTALAADPAQRVLAGVAFDGSLVIRMGVGLVDAVPDGPIESDCTELDLSMLAPQSTSPPN